MLNNISTKAAREHVSPECEAVHVVLGLYPRVRVHVPQLLPVHVVQQLRHRRHVEDVEVEEVVGVHQLAQHRLAWGQHQYHRDVKHNIKLTELIF